MSRALATLDDADHSTDQLGDQIIQLYANINAATYRLIKLLAQFDAEHTAQQQGFISTAAWLGYFCGIGTTAAREKVRVAKALDTLPAIDAAFAAGRLSYSKVRALTRVASPANELELLKIARCATAHQLARILRDYALVMKDPVDVPPQPRLTWYPDVQGNLVFNGRFPAEIGALMLRIIQRTAHAMGDSEHPQATQCAEALLALVQSGDQAAGRPVSSADRYTVHVELNPQGQAAQLRGGEVLARSAAERLTCDAAVVSHRIDAHGEPVGVGRQTRVVSGPLRRALIRRDRGCRFPGCTHTHFVDAHHVHHWAQGGATRLSNLILLCARHHRQVHEGVFRVHAHHPDQGATQFQFYSAAGKRLLPAGDQGLTNIKPLPEVPAVTSPASKFDTMHASSFKPDYPQARPDYHEIACYLANHVPRE